LPREEKGRGTGRAVVVDVDDRNARDADLVERALAAGRVTVDIADKGLLHVLVVDAGVGERHARRRRAHLVIGGAGSWLDEWDHPDARDIDLGQTSLPLNLR